jgi:mannose-6-phosphate isomerase-like protein (cupin superfamily)
MDERLNIIQNLGMVDYTVKFNDDDGSAKNAIKMVREIHPNDIIIFANGGDRNAKNIPEMELQNDIRYSNLKFEFGVGGTDKANSSSWILEEWKAPKTNRPWGYYRVLHENGPEVKLKELTVDPGMCLSMQKHDLRSEFWFVSEGKASIYSLEENESVHLGYYNKFDHIFIEKQKWHRLCNETDLPLKIIEVQYGEGCYEEDIERK